MKRVLLPLAFIFMVLGFPAAAMDIPMPCWDRQECFAKERVPDVGESMLEKRPDWHKRLDGLSPRMRQDADYSILYDFQKDRIPFVHTEESQRAVDEYAGDVISSVVSPLTYRLPLFPDLDMRRKKLNAAISNAIPEMKGGYYSVHFLPRVDFSRTNPVSLDIKVRDGKELLDLSIRIHETEITAPVYKGILAVGGYSFRDSSWYTYLVGKIPMPW